MRKNTRQAHGHNIILQNRRVGTLRTEFFLLFVVQCFSFCFNTGVFVVFLVFRLPFFRVFVSTHFKKSRKVQHTEPRSYYLRCKITSWRSNRGKPTTF